MRHEFKLKNESNFTIFPHISVTSFSYAYRRRINDTSAVHANFRYAAMAFRISRS
jgi:hypothetical protein